MLRNIQVQFEPIDEWPGERTRSRRRSTFKASWSDTCRLLERELGFLGCRRLVLQADCDRSQIRLDGFLRASARLNGPGVILAFKSKYGPLRYPCDQFDDWQDNVRAIALALEALRKVDRYGVTKRAEQYKGWQQLPPPSASNGGAEMTVEEAARFIAQHAPCLRENWRDLIGIPANVTIAVREAATQLHPDKGGDVKLFQRLMEAERILTRQS